MPADVKPSTGSLPVKVHERAVREFLAKALQ